MFILVNETPTKEIIIQRGLNGAKTSSHLFLHCQVLVELWSKVFGWLEFNYLSKSFSPF